MNNKAPQIRFAGFTDAWEQRRFADVLEYAVSNNTISRAGLNYNCGEVKNIHYGDILVKFDSIIDVNSDDVPYITNGKLSDFKSQLLCNGDVIFADTAEDETTGKAVEITGITNNYVVSGLHTIVARPTIAFAPNYLGYYLNSQAFRGQLIKLMQGIKVLSLSKRNMAKTMVSFPESMHEQKSIGIFLVGIDSLITLHQRKLDALKSTKKGFLQKMFPKDGESVPKIRFPGFTDAWEQRQLSDTVDVLDGDRGKNYPSTDDFLDQEHTLFLNASNVTKNGFSFDNNQFITEEKSNSLGNGKLELDDIVLTSRGSLGHIAWYNREIHDTIPNARINSGMLILRPNTLNSANYIAQYLKSPSGIAQIEFISFGSAQPQLTKRDVSNYKIYTPEKTEQDKLGVFFSYLDNLITLHQRELDLLKETKKALLQKMFI